MRTADMESAGGRAHARSGEKLVIFRLPRVIDGGRLEGIPCCNAMVYLQALLYQERSVHLNQNQCIRVSLCSLRFEI